MYPLNCSFQLVNNGPSAFSQATLEVRCPLRAQGHPLLYPVEVVTEGPLSCSSKNLNTMKLKVRRLTHASEAGMACRDTSLNASVDVFTPAAPACTNRWSHIIEIQKWASHPQQRAALGDPRWAWKPGEKEAIQVSDNEIFTLHDRQQLFCLLLKAAGFLVEGFFTLAKRPVAEDFWMLM